MIRETIMAVVAAAGAFGAGLANNSSVAGCCGMCANCCAAANKPAAGKQVKLMGTLVCGKCNLHQATKCTNVLQVKEGGKTVNYWLADKGNGETYHEGVCGGGTVEHVTVTGTLTEKDGKKVVKPTKVDVKK